MEDKKAVGLYEADAKQLKELDKLKMSLPGLDQLAGNPNVTSILASTMQPVWYTPTNNKSKRFLLGFVTDEFEVTFVDRDSLPEKVKVRSDGALLEPVSEPESKKVGLADYSLADLKKQLFDRSNEKTFDVELIPELVKNPYVSHIDLVCESTQVKWSTCVEVDQGGNKTHIYGIDFNNKYPLPGHKEFEPMSEDEIRSLHGTLKSDKDLRQLMDDPRVVLADVNFEKEAYYFFTVGEDDLPTGQFTVYRKPKAQLD